MTKIPGKTVLITGGIGRQLARKVAAQGARVVLWDIDADRLSEVAEDVRAGTCGNVARYVCDVSDRRAVYDAAGKVKREIGTVQILVNSAGVVSGQWFLDCSDQQIQQTLAVNTMALFWTVKAFLPDMVAEGAGHLVTVASAAGVIGVTRLADYSASKWAATGFDEALRMELRRIAPKVRTTVVCPYFVDTGMFGGVKTRFPWLLPILKEEVVAERIIRAIRWNRARVMMPRIVYLVPLLRVLPTRWFDGLAGLLGVHHAMDHFVGRAEPDHQSAVSEGDETP